MKAAKAFILPRDGAYRVQKRKLRKEKREAYGKKRTERRDAFADGALRGNAG